MTPEIAEFLLKAPLAIILMAAIIILYRDQKSDRKDSLAAVKDIQEAANQAIKDSGAECTQRLRDQRADLTALVKDQEQSHEHQIQLIKGKGD